MKGKKRRADEKTYESSDIKVVPEKQAQKRKNPSQDIDNHE